MKNVYYVFLAKGDLVGKEVIEELQYAIITPLEA